MTTKKQFPHASFDGALSQSLASATLKKRTQPQIETPAEDAQTAPQSTSTSEPSSQTHEKKVMQKNESATKQSKAPKTPKTISQAASFELQQKNEGSGNAKALSQTTLQKGDKKVRLHKADHDPRAAALVALWRVIHEGVDSQAAVDDALFSPSLMPTNKRLCTELVYGTLRQYIRLEWFLYRCLEKPEKLPEEMRLCLIMTLYEMTYLRIPHHASVGWSVTHIQNRFGHTMGRVANGTLRTLQRRLRDFHKPEFYKEACPTKIEALAYQQAMPEWIIQLWLDAYGEEKALELLYASNQPAPSGLRINPQKKDWHRNMQELLETEYAPKKQAKHFAQYARKEASYNAPDEESKNSLQTSPSPQTDAPMLHVEPILPSGLMFPGTLPWLGKELVKTGKASRQSAASYQILMSLSPDLWPQPIWDMCAGRGGKTLALLERGIPVALATDPAKQRLSMLPNEHDRLGITLPAPTCLPITAQEILEKIIQRDNRSEIPCNGEFKTLLIDAPCSGLGTLSRHPEIRLRRTPDDVTALIATQRDLLEKAHTALPVEGQIVYITCTINPLENEEQVKGLLARHPDLVLVKETTTSDHPAFNEFFYGALIKKVLRK